MSDGTVDQWAAWLLERRHGGDPELLRATLERLSKVRERVLDNAGIRAGETVLDVGCGDGLIAFGALDRVGPEGQVIFSDISHDLLDHARHLAERVGTLDRCRFVEASAEDLAGIDDASVDIVTTRSVLAYVPGKRAAFTAFARVLRPGGRFSIYEPVNRHLRNEQPGRFFGCDVTEVQDLATRIEAAYERCQPGDDPMFDYDERDLLAWAGDAGFTERELELRIAVGTRPPGSWESLLNTAPNPKAPTLAEAMDEVLSADEQATFIAHIKPQYEAGGGESITAIAYLWGRKG